MIKYVKDRTVQIWLRAIFFISNLPKRLFRTLKHTYALLQLIGSPSNYSFKSFLVWFVELPFYFLDIFGIPEIYETLIDLAKINSRPLNKHEISLAKSIFLDTIDYDRIRIDRKAYLGPRKGRYAYVSFYTINYWGDSLPDDILIHELVHIWQFDRFGSVYIPRALMAQQSENGYNYGGLKSLLEVIESGGNLLSFNYEQQGDIIRDYFLITQGSLPKWGRGQQDDIHIYEHFVKDLYRIYSWFS